MTGGLVALGVAAATLAGEVVSRVRTSSGSLLAACVVVLGVGLGLRALVFPTFADPSLALAPLLVLLLGGATLLARPPSWREPTELGQLTESTVLLALAFTVRDLGAVGCLWLASLVPGLRFRERPGLSRRPFVLLAVVCAAPVALALAAHASGRGPDAGVYLGLVVGAAARMGVPPFSPLVMTSYERLPVGRTALVAAARPSVALLLVARGTLPDQVAPFASALQGWAAVAAVLAALQGLAATTPRRSLGAMATTQASILLYGLVSPGETGVLGALVQWAGLGLSLVGLGLLVEATECRVGHRRSLRVRGLLRAAPGMALLFLLFAATMSGFPGTAGFAGEDLVIQAETAHPLLSRPLLVAATALNGATMLRMFARMFLGAPDPSEVADFPPLGPRERLALGLVAAAVVLLALSPGSVAASG